MRPLTASFALALSCLCAVVAPAQGARTLPVVFHVVHERDAPVVDETFIADELANANEIFAPLDVVFTLSRTLPLPAKHAALVTRDDRDALLRRAQKVAFVEPRARRGAFVRRIRRDSLGGGPRASRRNGYGALRYAQKWR